MKKAAISLGVALVVVLAFLAKTASHAHAVDGVLRYTQEQLTASRRQVGDLQERLRPFEEKRAATTKIQKEFDLSAGMVQSISFTPRIVPGTLSGTWRASGRGWGGNDDTISGFRLSDPNDYPLASSDRATSGRFLVKVAASGRYTFYFENTGLFRQTPRKIFLDGEFRPD